MFSPSELDECLVNVAIETPDISVVAAGSPGKVDGFAVSPGVCLAESEAAAIDPDTTGILVACLKEKGFGVTIHELGTAVGTFFASLVRANFEPNPSRPDIDVSLEYTPGVSSAGSGSLCQTAQGDRPLAGFAFLDRDIPLSGGFPARFFRSAGIKVKVVGLDLDPDEQFTARLLVRTLQILGPTETADCGYFVERSFTNIATGFNLLTFECFESEPSELNPASCPSSLEAAKGDRDIFLGRDDGVILEFSGASEKGEDEGFFVGFFNRFFVPEKEMKSIGFCVDELTLELSAGIGLISIDFEVAA